MRRLRLGLLSLLGFLGVLVSGAMAQSNLTYELRVGETGKAAVVDTFPGTYAGEKVNISIQSSAISHQASDSLDFVFVYRLGGNGLDRMAQEGTAEEPQEACAGTECIRSV